MNECVWLWFGYIKSSLCMNYKLSQSKGVSNKDDEDFGGIIEKWIT